MSDPNDNINGNGDTETELQRLQEENFDLQATIATLQAETQFEIASLQRTASTNESKWKADLRLAQQDAQRWRSMAQQQQGIRASRSIVSSSSLSNRLPQLGQTAVVSSSTVVAAAASREDSGEATPMNVENNDNEGMSHILQLSPPQETRASVPDFSKSPLPSTKKSKSENDSRDLDPTIDVPTSNPADYHDDVILPPSSKRHAATSSDSHRRLSPIITSFHPTSHLASNLLTNTTQETMAALPEKCAATDDNGEANTKVDPPTTTKVGSPSSLEQQQQLLLQRIRQDSHLRQILIGIACSGGSGSGGGSFHSSTLDATTSTATTTTTAMTTDTPCWTEEELIEWLICQHTTPFLASPTPSPLDGEYTSRSKDKQMMIIDEEKKKDDNSNGIVVDKEPTSTSACHEHQMPVSMSQIVSSSISPADKYWSLALVVSPAARQHVLHRILKESNATTAATTVQQTSVVNDGNDESKMDVEFESETPAITLSSHRFGGRRRKSRIRPLGENRDKNLFFAHFEAVRKALHNPFWDPNTPVPYPPKVVAAQQETYQVPSDGSVTSLKPFRQFLQFLAASCYIPHLRTLQVLLEEASGLDNVNVDTATVWWDLCFGPIINTIQRIIYPKILAARPKGITSEVEAATTKSTSRARSRSNGRAGGEKSRARRRRTKNVSERLQALNKQIGTSTYHASNSSTSKKKDGDGNSTKSNNVSSSGKDEDDVLEYALGVLLGLFRVTPIDKLEEWYENNSGWEQNGDERLSEPGGFLVVSILLDLMDYLLFVEWKQNDSPMHPKEVLAIDGFRSKGDETTKKRPAATAIPPYYLVSIVILQQVGRTRGGLTLLRTRVKDDQDYDLMGNALDVAIKHLHALAWHWDNHRVMDGAIIDFDQSPFKHSCAICKEKRTALVEAVENWVRLWHQILLYVQQSCQQDQDIISFRSLVLEMQNDYTAACAILLSSEETRSEIKTMIRWHLEELAFDEEEFLEAEEEKKMYQQA